LPDSLADWLALMAGLCFALTNILLRKLNQTPGESRMLAMFAGGAVMATSAALLGQAWGVVLPPPALDAAWSALAVGTGLALLAGNLALQYGAARLSASATSLIMLSEVVFASVSSVLLGTGELSVRTLAGGALILLASLLAVLSFAER
jgi:drug/metabolite transporter (DMT)-like permease